jgi:hypothetical protein
MYGSKQVFKRPEQGLSVTGLIMILAVLGFIGVFAARIMPTFMEYRAFVNAIRLVKSSGGTVHEMQVMFDKNADINNATAITGKDLTISKESGETEISFAYEKRIPIIANATLLLDYSATTAKDGVVRTKEAAPQ